MEPLDYDLFWIQSFQMSDYAELIRQSGNGEDSAACYRNYESWRFLLTTRHRKFVLWGHRVHQIKLIDTLAIGKIHGLTGMIHFAERMDVSALLDLGETILPVLCEAQTRSS